MPFKKMSNKKNVMCQDDDKTRSLKLPMHNVCEEVEYLSYKLHFLILYALNDCGS